MKIYHYDQDTGVFVGSDRARIDPMETKVQGETKYLVPAGATTEPPPGTQEGYVPLFVGGTWDVVEDHRGPVWDVDTKEVKEWDRVGPLPDQYVKVAPPSPRHVWDGEQWYVPLDRAVSEKKAQILGERNRRIRLGFTWHGSVWDADPEGRGHLSGVVSLANAGLVLPSNLRWRDANNRRWDLSVAEFVGLGAAMFAFVNDHYQAAFDHKDAVDAIADDTSLTEAERVAKIDAYDASLSWP